MHIDIATLDHVNEIACGIVADLKIDDGWALDFKGFNRLNAAIDISGNMVAALPGTVAFSEPVTLYGFDGIPAEMFKNNVFAMIREKLLIAFEKLRAKIQKMRDAEDLKATDMMPPIPVVTNSFLPNGNQLAFTSTSVFKLYDVNYQTAAPAIPAYWPTDQPYTAPPKPANKPEPIEINGKRKIVLRDEESEVA